LPAISEAITTTLENIIDVRKWHFSDILSRQRKWPVWGAKQTFHVTLNGGLRWCYALRKSGDAQIKGQNIATYGYQRAGASRSSL